MTPQFYFFRDNNGNEVDLIIEDGQSVHAIEIKYGKTINDDFFRGLTIWSKISNAPSSSCYIVYGGDTKSNYRGVNTIPWNALDLITGSKK